jgi:hypothetical protein
MNQIIRNSIIGVLILLTAALAALGGSGEAPSQDKSGRTDAGNNATPVWSVPGFRTDFSRIAVDPAQVISGGPAKDGIPAVDSPAYESSAKAAEWLANNEPVILVSAGGKARIYPIQILTWHEIVNDTVGGVPVAVTFCPLCNTGVVFRRTYAGRVLDFGTTGRLRDSNLIMYDRQTESWWQQATGEAIIGEFTGGRLGFHPALTLSFADARKAEPAADVLSRTTGYSRPYGQNPYEGYDSRESRPFLYYGTVDGSLEAMDRVVILIIDDQELIVPYSAVMKTGTLSVNLGGVPVVMFWTPGTSSALDTRSIADGRDVGSLNAYRTAEGTQFTARSGGFFVDSLTGSVWTGAGHAVEGSLRGQSLEPVVAVGHFWFSAQAFASEGPGALIPD